MFPLKSTAVNIVFIVVFGVCSLFSVLGLIGIMMPGGVGFPGGALTKFFTVLFLAMPWLTLYISISHLKLLNAQTNNVAEHFQ